jgi:hypothetical protein
MTEVRPGLTPVLAAYLSGLTDGRAEILLNTLAPEAVLRSPFHTWPARHLPSVFRARCAAFADLRVDRVLGDGDAAAISWQAEVDGRTVEAVELVEVSGDAVTRVDVFLRPASVLDVVERAMTREWPS